MRFDRSNGRYLAAAIAILVTAGTLTPALILAQAATAAATKDQLSLMVTTAQGSRAYAQDVVGAAEAHGLDTSAARSRLSAGDGLLAAAQADLSTSSNLDAGVQSARAAMEDYASAAASASSALSNAGLTPAVGQSSLADAVDEVNSTASLIAEVSASVCEGTGLGAGAAALQSACAEIKAALASAANYLTLASASANLTQAFILVAEARSQVSAADAALASIASLTYLARGQAYVADVLLGLSAQANATVAAQQNAAANLASARNAFYVAVNAEAVAVGSMLTESAGLFGAIGQVDTSSVSASASSAQTVSSEVSQNMTYLLSLVQGIPGAGTLVASIGVAETASSDYSSAVGTANSASSAFLSQSFSGFPDYLASVQTDQANVLTSESSYLSSFASVQTDLKSLLALLDGAAPPLLVQENSTLNSLGLSVASSTSAFSSSLQAEVDALSNVLSDVSSTTAGVSSWPSDFLVGNSTIATVASVSVAEAGYLNSSGLALVAQASAAVNGTAAAAVALKALVASTLAGTLGGFYASGYADMSSQGQTLLNLGSSAESSLVAALAVVEADATGRANDVAVANSEISDAFAFFSAGNISAGAASMAEAHAELQLASAVYVH